MAAAVVGPDGVPWEVRRRWAPRFLGRETPWRRFRRRVTHWRERAVDVGDVADPGCALDVADSLAAAAVALAIVAVLVLLAVVVLPVLLAAVEVLVLLLLGGVGVVGKVLLRRPWVVQATAADGRHHEWRVVGWRASGAHVELVAQHLEATGQPPPVAP